MLNIKKILLYTAVVLPLLLIIITLAVILKKTGSIEDRIISEFTVNNEQIEIIRKNLVRLSSDVNQTRNLVGLPESDYSFESSDGNNNSSNTKQESDNTVYFLGFEYLKNHFNDTELLRKLSLMADSDLLKSAASESSLEIMETGDGYILQDNSGNIYFRLKADSSDNTIIAESVFSSIDKGFFPDASAEKASEYITVTTPLVRSLYKALNANITELRNITGDSVVKATLRKNKLYFDNFSSGQEKTAVKIKRESGVTIATVILDHAENIFSFCSKKYTDYNTLRNDILNISHKCDIRTDDEKRIEKSRENLKILNEDENFIKYLSDNGYAFSDTVREDKDYYYYDINSLETGLKIGSYAVHKVSGEIYLTDHEEVPLSSLNRFDSSSKKKN